MRAWKHRHAESRGTLSPAMTQAPLDEPLLATRMFYVHDPLCGWCYAMQPALRALHETHPELPIETFNIGLWVAGACRPIVQGFREHLRAGVPRVEALSSVRFGPEFRRGVIDNDHYVYESGTAALALQCIKRLAPDKPLDFIHDCQEAFFVEGQSANDVTTFIRIAAGYGISAVAFAELFYSTRVRDEMQAERKQAAELCQVAGSAGVPVFLLNRGSKVLPINHGAACVPEQFIQRVDAARDALEAA